MPTISLRTTCCASKTINVGSVLISADVILMTIMSSSLRTTTSTSTRTENVITGARFWLPRTTLFDSGTIVIETIPGAEHDMARYSVVTDALLRYLTRQR